MLSYLAEGGNLPRLGAGLRGSNPEKGLFLHQRRQSGDSGACQKRTIVLYYLALNLQLTEHGQNGFIGRDGTSRKRSTSM
jgi:hypothetical protein